MTLLILLMQVVQYLTIDLTNQNLKKEHYTTLYM